MNKPPIEDSDPGFGDEERITKDLNLKSISPNGRFLLGGFALIPKTWRGPVIMAAFGLLGYFGPKLIDFILSKVQQ